MISLRVLSGLAVVQAALAVVTWWPNSPDVGGQNALVDGAPDAITRILLTGSTENATPVELQREGSGWVLASADNWPVESASVDSLLQDLTALQQQAQPVATQATSHAALGVDTEDFSRRIEWTINGETTSVFMGAGAGNSVHVRRADEDAVYRATGASLSDFGASAGSYVDTTWLTLTQDDIASISIQRDGQSLDLARIDGQWLLAQTPPGQQTKQSEANRIAQQLSSLNLVEPVADPGDAFGPPTTVRWTLANGDSGTVEIGAETNGGYYARRPGTPGTVRVSSYGSSALREAAVSTLTEAMPAPAAPAAPPAPAAPTAPGVMPTPLTP